MAMKVRVLVVSTVLLSTMWVTGCGGHYTCGTTFGNATCTPSGGGISGGGGNNGNNNIGVTSFVYFMNDTAQQIAVEGLNVANSENFLPDSNFVSPAFPANLGNNGGVVIVNKQYLYIPFLNGPVYGFSIDATTGDLTPVPNSGSILVPGTGTTVAADPAGNVLFVGGSAGITAFTINLNDGSLTAVGTVTASNPTQLATDGAGLYLYALTGSTITAFSYTASGTMAPVSGSPFPISGMAQIAGESTGKFLFGIKGETGGGSGLIDKNIYVFSIAAGGGLNVFGSPVPTQNAPGYLAVSPNGKFVYTFNQTADAAGTVNDPMEGFAFSTGVLTELSGVSPFSGLDAQLGKFDQSGEYIFAVADVPSSSVSGMFAYGVSSSGALSSTLSHAGVASLSFAVTDEP
jgi:hypothetical protein